MICWSGQCGLVSAITASSLATASSLLGAEAISCCSCSRPHSDFLQRRVSTRHDCCEQVPVGLVLRVVPHPEGARGLHDGSEVLGVSALESNLEPAPGWRGLRCLAPAVSRHLVPAIAARAQQDQVEGVVDSRVISKLDHTVITTLCTIRLYYTLDLEGIREQICLHSTNPPPGSLCPWPACPAPPLQN